MKSALTVLLATLLLPVIACSQFSVPDLSVRGDFMAMAKQIEHHSPFIQKLYAANAHAIKADMTEEEAKELIHKKLDELNNPELNKKYSELNGEQLTRVGIILYALMNGLTNSANAGVDFKLQFGYGLGAFAMFTLANFVLMPELSLLFRTVGWDSGSTTFLERFTYLTIAFTAMYIIRAQTLNFLVGLSPTLGYAIKGIYKVGDDKEDIDFDDDGVKRVNIGLAITAGVMLQNAIMIRLLYNMGLTKMYDNVDYRMYMFALAVSIPLWTLQ